uniref:Uncharacterized protein n=1 Tax=Clytia hemisphaerica TaxID=252671 RepID=A0A7M5VCQ9_9CNID
MLKNVKMDITGSKDKTPQKDFDNNIVSQLKTILETDLSHINEIEIHRASSNDSNENNEEENHFGLKELKSIISEYEILKDTYVALQKQVEAKFQENELHLKLIDEQKLEIKRLQESNKSLLDQIDTLNQTSKKEKEKESASREELSTAYQKTIDRLENDIKQQKALTSESNEKLTAHDAAAKRAIGVLQKEMGAKVEQVTKLYQDTMKEKDGHLIKISKLEALNYELKQNNTTQSKKILDQQNEIETTKSSLKSKTDEIKSIFSNSESHEKEFAKLHKKIETQQEEIKNQETKINWAQNKLTAELEAHKETKKLISQYQSRIQQAKEEGDMIRKDCQQMIERYQGDEEIKSVRLDKELEECRTKLKEHDEESSKQLEINKEQELAISIIKEDNSKLADELCDKKNQFLVLEGRNSSLLLQLNEKTKDYAEMETKLDEMKEKVKTFEDVQATILEYETTIKGLQMVETTLKQQLHDAELEAKEQSERHQEILQYSQSLTENNVSSKSTVAELQTKLDAVMLEKAQSSKDFNETQTSIGKLEKEKKQIQEALDVANNTIKEKDTQVQKVNDTLEEAKDELKVLKKKNAALVKDLQRQLQQTTKKIEQMESSNNGSNENLSSRSRTSSCNSLERVGQNPESPPNASPLLQHESVMIPQDHYISQPHRALQPQQFPEVEIDKKVLIERICKLQRVLAKKNEKLEFMEEHINQLTQDIQRKTKIIQSYVLKEESGSIAPDRYDRIKAEVSQHGGIMASVYSGKTTDKGMTLDLSLTINRKLQAVLEDTILKNITLKENINTLGAEIAKLSNDKAVAEKT